MKIRTAVTFLIGLGAGGLLVTAALGVAGGRPLLQLCPIPSPVTNAALPGPVAPATQDTAATPR